jgi:hypothetical protein
MPFAIFAVLSDVSIAVALCVLLHGSRTNFRRCVYLCTSLDIAGKFNRLFCVTVSTNAIVTTLTIYAINRCLLTS